PPTRQNFSGLTTSPRTPLFSTLSGTLLRSLFRSLQGGLQRGRSTTIERPHWNISGDVGLVSAGRINKDTPPLTTPGHTSRSSAMDISAHIFQIEIHEEPDIRFRLPGDPRPV